MPSLSSMARRPIQPSGSDYNEDGSPQGFAALEEECAAHPRSLTLRLLGWVLLSGMWMISHGVALLWWRGACGKYTQAMALSLA